MLKKEKVARRVRGFLRSDFFGVQVFRQIPFTGYEIHVGETLYENRALPLGEIEREGATELIPDGAVSQSRRIFGTYVHGFFDGDEFRHDFIRAARAAVGLAPAIRWINSHAERDARIDGLADHLKKALDINSLKSWLAEPSGSKPTAAREPLLAV
jgi:adenosylcobyric acid synthase